VQAGRASWEIASAEAGLQQAEAALDAARVALERTVLYAPFGGVVTRVDTEVGNTVAPGQAVVVLAALDELQVRTIDLTELDVVRVVPDQAATVTVDALPDTPLRGHVARIGLRDVDYRGDVTYPVIVELDETVPELRWGMTALVEIEVD
jgi:multidrug resistance efflux pump